MAEPTVFERIVAREIPAAAQTSSMVTLSRPMVWRQLRAASMTACSASWDGASTE